MKKIYWISLICVIVLCLPLISILHANESASKAMTKKCPTCNKVYPEETKFCGEDGTKLFETPVKMICPDCMKEGAPGEKFCKEHGKKLVPLTETPPARETDAIKKKVELARKYYKEGSDYCDAESYDLALESYKKAEKAFPDFPELHYNMGWLYGKLGDAQQAINHLQKYIVLSPNAKDIMEVQSYVIVLKQALEKQSTIHNTFKSRDEIMKMAVLEQKQKYVSAVVSAGEFIMGSDQAREDAYPEHKIYLNAFEIDCYEVTNAQYWEFLEYIKKTNDHSKCFKGEPSNNDHTPTFWDNEYYNVPDYPVARIDWYDAYAYAAWAGKRLPTDAEWEKAARGSDGRTWPWGDDWDIKKANVFSGDTTPIGQFSPAGDSPYGCADMAGNVWEWIGGGSPSQLRAPLRGGDWLDGPEEAKTTHIRMHTPHRKNPFVGFRCAADSAEPTK